MAFGSTFGQSFADFCLDGGTFVTVFSILDCALLCMNTRNCSSFFYNHHIHSCASSPARYQESSGLTPHSGFIYYIYFHVRGPELDGQLESAALITEGSQQIPEKCKAEPTYVNQGAVRKRKFSKPGYPVVIEYECDHTTDEKYKYFSGPKEAFCDGRGTWTLPAMFCVPTSCYTKVVDSSGNASAVYGGDTHQDKEGRECQAWEENRPHTKKRNYKVHGTCSGCGSVEDTGNKCRDMSHSTKPFCFTMDPKTKLSYCDISECKKERRCACPLILRGAHAIRTELIGQKVLVTYRCREDLRYISGRNMSTCDMKTGVWESLDLLCASENCFYYDPDQWNRAIYHGNVSMTKTGRTCQRWECHVTHQHTVIATQIPGATSLEELGNVCRDPDGERSPWCYTTDPDRRWEFCTVPECIFNTSFHS